MARRADGVPAIADGGVQTRAGSQFTSPHTEYLVDPFLNVDQDLDFSKYEVRDLLAGRKKIVEELDRIGPNGIVDEEHELRYDALIERTEHLDAHLAERQKVERRSQAVQRLRSPGTAQPPSTPANIPVRGTEPVEQRDLLSNLDGGTRPYSLLRAINLICRNKPLDGLEAEVNQELETRAGKAARGFYLPWTLPLYRSGLPRNIEFRDGPTGFSTVSGSGLIPTIQASTLVDVLRNRMVLASLGAQIMTGMVGEFDLPKKTATSQAYWIGEQGEPTESNPVIGQIPFAPNTVGAYTDLTRRLIKQSSFDAEQIARQDLMEVLQIELDRVGLNGSGEDNEPLGILQDDGIAVVELGEDGGFFTWSKLVEMETEVAVGNADIGNLAYVTSARGRGMLKSTPKVYGGETMLWEDNMLNGYRAVATNQIPSDLEKGEGDDLTAMIFGNFQDVIYAFWGAIDVMIDPYSLSKSGGVRVVLLADADVKRRRDESFAVCVDMDPAAEPFGDTTG